MQKLRERYSYVPPLVFQRSVERAKDIAELFDILETVPRGYPIAWDNVARKWVSSLLFAEPGSVDFEKKHEQPE